MEDVTPGLWGVEVRKDKNNSLFFEEPNGTSSKLTQKHRPLALKHTRVYSLFYYEVYEFNFIKVFSTHTFFSLENIMCEQQILTAEIVFFTS